MERCTSCVGVACVIILWVMTYKRRNKMYLKTKDVDIYYERLGKGRPLVLIHGAVADASYFDETREYLKDYFDVITYDRRGYSRSVCKDQEHASYSIQDHAKDLVNLIEGLDLHGVVLVGHSAGGIMAMEAFQMIPGRIAHVVLYETPLISMLAPERRDKLYQWNVRLEDMNRRGLHKETAREFGISVGELDPRAREKEPYEKKKDRMNFAQFINYEFHEFTYYKPDFEFLKANARYITLMSGDRNQGHYFHSSMDTMEKEVGAEQVHVPGCHNAPFDVPLDFANGVLGILLRRGLVRY